MLYSLKSVVVRFGNNVPALSSVYLEIEAGRVLLISGPTGAGKTTLLRLLYADIKPSSGNIIFKHEDFVRLSRKQKNMFKKISGIIFQEPRLVSTLTCYENIILQLVLNKNSKQDSVAMCLEIMAGLGINYLRSGYPKELSIGEKKLVQTARAFVHNPEILIADEPTDNLDEEAKEKVLELMKNNLDNGSSLIIATNDKFLYNNFPDAKKIVLHEGRIAHNYKYKGS